jgi:hypothetical protein
LDISLPFAWLGSAHTLDLYGAHIASFFVHCNIFAALRHKNRPQLTTEPEFRRSARQLCGFSAGQILLTKH